MKPILQYLSQEEVAVIHESALKILSEIGFRFPLEDALTLLEKEGAHVHGHVARIPRELVVRAMERVPKRDQVTLYGRDRRHDLTFDKHEPTLACMTMAVSVIDPYTREKRPATDKDLADLTRIADQLDHIKVNGGLITPQEVPGAFNDWYTWATTLKNTTKHITGGMLGARCVRDAARMASIAVGSEEEFRSRPFISGWVLTLPPLGIDRESLDAMMEMSRWNIPFMLSSGPMMGASSPVTVAGTLAQAHAEILACIVLAQLTHPGCPVVYTSFARGLDMRTGAVTMASPEFAILKVAMAQMGHFLGLPVRMPGMLRDSKMLDAQAGFETGMVGTACALTADLIDGMQLDSDLLVDFADLVFCNECMGALKRFSEQVTVSEETLALDALREVGHGGSFLGHDHTLRHFRKELWHPILMERRNWEKWKRDGGLTMTEVANKRMLEILEAESKDRWSPEAEAEIDFIVKKVEKDYTSTI